MKFPDFREENEQERVVKYCDVVLIEGETIFPQLWSISSDPFHKPFLSFVCVC